ncbi:PREDICTED: uncharacterized protein LOC103597282 [Galeopterus variegatus]|uniref:Uncharacterized protein LOC103597282 n=1 Tax=Galeopterus variegatus TaxID=482537 RepID=A0ABM0RFC9_GALVR|nr:PREDICTED: uncharacterized protein LOC103597282 [Galeopterus variegatus]
METYRSDFGLWQEKSCSLEEDAVGAGVDEHTSCVKVPDILSSPTDVIEKLLIGECTEEIKEKEEIDNETESLLAEPLPSPPSLTIESPDLLLAFDHLMKSCCQNCQQSSKVSSLSSHGPMVPQTYPILCRAPQMSPLQKALLMARERGKDGLQGYRCYPITGSLNAEGGVVQEYRLLPFKTPKELKTVVAQYGATAPFTLSLLETMAVEGLPAVDWKNIARACLSGGEYLLWKSEFSECAQEQSECSHREGLEVTFDMLAGEGDFSVVVQQLGFSADVYQQMNTIAQQAGRRLPMAVGRLVVDGEAGMLLTKQLAYENASLAARLLFTLIRTAIIFPKNTSSIPLSDTSLMFTNGSSTGLAAVITDDQLFSRYVQASSAQCIELHTVCLHSSNQQLWQLLWLQMRGPGVVIIQNTEGGNVGACLLVQDACGMFGEVHLQGAVLKDRQLEGKACSLAGMKILQKATRARMAGLFSLIDTLWPPSRPLKAPGRSQPSEEQVKTHLPPPTFCYILMAHPNLGQIDVIEEDPISKLYQPPIPRCLREILQTDDLGTRCSFYAKVIYQRPQLKSLLLLEQREISLLVTDATLQAKDESEPSLPKTVQVFVAPSCVLDLQVLEALTMATPHSILFRDALCDHGQIVCVERTVILLQKPLSCVASGARFCEVTGPVMLDELDSATTANSICSVQGGQLLTGKGAVVGVDESTAFSWPVCDQCGSGRLEQRPEDRGTFYCGDCSRVVTAPVLKRHLQVFLDCPSRPQCRVKVKLSQSSISSLLGLATCEDGSYEVQSVLGKEVGSLNCFVRSITTHPTNCVGLEEIELLGAGGTSAERLP